MKIQNKRLVRAVQLGNIDKVRQLLKLNPDLNLLDDSDMPLIMWAIQERYLDIARLLVQNGANPNSSAGDNTPLIYAASQNDIESLETLFSLGADINHKESSGTALHFACAYENKEAADWLIKHRADVDATDNDGRTPIFFAIEAENLDLVKLLLSNGARVNLLDKEGISPLDTANSTLAKAVQKIQSIVDAIKSANLTSTADR